jgi:hypothetical protein
MHAGWTGPWICCGDFNEALSQDEHFGSSNRSDSQIQLFKDCLTDCGLSDMGFSGPMFTWTNKQENESNIRVRLDRAVANGEFLALFDEYSVENVITTTSDHYAVFIDLKKHSDEHATRPVKTGFRYEAAWLRSPDYRPMLERAWEDNSVGTVSLQSTWTKLQRVGTSLAQWSIDSFGSVRKEINRLERRLKFLRLAPWGSGSEEIKDIERSLCEMFEREEVMARQRSRVDWLKEGDRNTSFFHSRICSPANK